MNCCPGPPASPSLLAANEIDIGRLKRAQVKGFPVPEAELVRALVETGVRRWQSGEAPDLVRPEVLRLAGWQASRTGIEGALLDPRTWRPALTWTCCAGSSST
jgi:hypothetical protein